MGIHIVLNIKNYDGHFNTLKIKKKFWILLKFLKK